MSRIYDLYLRDIIKASKQIENYLNEISETEFKADQLRVDGVLFNLMIVGEAVKNLPDELKARSPEVQWRNIARFRDRVVHHYFSTNLDIVWEIVQVHLPALRKEVEILLNDVTDEEK